MGNPSTGAGAAPEPATLVREVGARRAVRPCAQLGGMAKKKDDRDSPISIRMPPHLKEVFLRNVEASGESKNGYILRCIFGANAPRAARTRHIEKQMLAQLLALSGSIRDALDEAVRVAGDEARVAEAVEAATAELEIIATTVLKLMGRGP